MKELLKKISITKMSFFITIVVLLGITIYLSIVFGSDEVAKTIIELFKTVVISMVSFYFWQKGIKKEKDPLMKE